MNVTDNDEVIRELDVFVTDELELYLLQLPLKPCYGDTAEIYSAKFKPKHRILEVEGDKTIPKLSSSVITKSTRLAVAVIRDNVMHITPVKDVLQLRPSFNTLQQRGEMVEAMSDDEDAEDDPKEKGLEQVLRCLIVWGAH